jgi:hypothetical protein
MGGAHLAGDPDEPPEVKVKVKRAFLLPLSR